MGYIKREIFEGNISEGNLKSLNKLLISDKLVIENKEKAFSIATFLIENETTKEMYLDSFIDFCLNDRTYKTTFSKRLFSILLSKINYEFDNVTEEESFLLKDKIYTVSIIGLNELELSDEEHFSLLTKILFSNIDDTTYYFIRELFKNDVMKINGLKRNIVLDIVLANKIDEVVLDTTDYPSILDIITDENILMFDDDNYKKVVNMVIKGNKKENYILIKIMQNKDLTLAKKISVINYLYKVEKYLNRYAYDNLENILEQSEVNLFNIVYCENLIMMNDKNYANALSNLGNTNKPLSYMKVLASTKISDEQREFALDLINQGEIQKTKYYINYNGDYKKDVALAAISPVLINMPIDIYKKILLLVNNWCEMLNEIYSSGRIDDRINFGAVSSCVIGLLYCSELYNQNVSKLLIAIDELIEVRASKKLVDEVFLFCSNSLSVYYTDEEYKRILELIKEFYEKVMSHLIKNLFTNANVPFMKDKNELFEVAIKGDKDKIQNLIVELNVQGNYIMNINCIFYGVDENTSRVISSNIKKVKVKSFTKEQ